jgi:hypothetical protein
VMTPVLWSVEFALYSQKIKKSVYCNATGVVLKYRSSSRLLQYYSTSTQTGTRTESTCTGPELVVVPTLPVIRALAMCLTLTTIVSGTEYNTGIKLE